MFSKANQKQEKNAVSNEELALITAIASKASPVNELNADNRSALCKTATVAHMQRNDQLKPENSHRYLMYLVEGSVYLYNGKDEVGTLSAGSSGALQPLFSDKTAYQSIKSPGLARIARFGREQMDILLSEQQKNAVTVHDVHLSELDNLIFDDIRQVMVDKKLVLASFSESSARILKAIANKAGIPELADIIQSDPGLAASIIRASQRTEGSDQVVQTVRGAISRLGVEATIQAITAQLKENTIVCDNPVIEDRFRKYVKRSLMATRVSVEISGGISHLQPEEAALNSLVSDIGELAIITSANKFSDQIKDEAEFKTCIENLRVIISQWILKSWNFPSGFVDSAMTARDWYRNHPGDISLADVHTASLLAINGASKDAEQSSIPNANNLLLARRLHQAGIDLTSPEALLKRALTKKSQDDDLREAG